MSLLFKHLCLNTRRTGSVHHHEDLNDVVLVRLHLWPWLDTAVMGTVAARQPAERCWAGLQAGART